MVISESYAALNRKLHEAGGYGKSGHRWAKVVEQIIQNYKIESVLDYGAGQQTLERALQANSTTLTVNFRSYDPAVEELSKEPRPADLLTCTDVLEHVEPEYLTEVLDHICRLTLKLAFLVIPTGPAGKFLADGRNAHLIQKPLEWWMELLTERFNVVSINNMTGDIVLLLSKRTSNGALNDQINKHIRDILRDNHIMSFYFDGLSINVFMKSKRTILRFLPRLISVLRLGRRTGISESLRDDSSAIRIHLVKH